MTGIWLTRPTRPESQEWREELTEEESAYVQARDKHYERGVAALCSAILVRERVRQRYRPEEIAELKTVYDHCRLRCAAGRCSLPGGPLLAGCGWRKSSERGMGMPAAPRKKSPCGCGGIRKGMWAFARTVMSRL